MERLTIQVGGYEANCSILSADGRAFVVDPGSEGDRIVELLAKKGLEPAAILLTHAHFDHISGIPALQKAFPGIPVYVHPGDVPMFGHPLNQAGGEYAPIGRPSGVRDVETLAELLPGVGVIHTHIAERTARAYPRRGDGSDADYEEFFRRLIKEWILRL